MSDKEQVAINSFLNIIAAAIPLLALQLVALPVIASSLGSEEYGLVVTLVSLFALIPTVLGNALNNVRLINDLSYETEGLSGDFNILAAILVSIGMVATGTIGLIYVGVFSFYDLIGLSAVAALCFFDNYYSVGFLVDLNYKKVLIKNTLKTIGHFCGLLVFLKFGYWYWVYIIGYGLACFYIALSTELVREPLALTSRFRKTSGDTAMLVFAAFLGNVITHADRLLLFPLLGGASVAVYYASTLLGKILSMVINPTSNVLLATIGRKNRMDLANLKILLCSSLVFGVIVYGVCVALARPVIGLLYPNLVDAAMSLIFVTTAISAVDSLKALINPVVLRFCNTIWQIVLGVMSIVVYVTFAFLFLHCWGLIGFAGGVLVSSIFSVVIRLVIIYCKRNAIMNCK